MGTVKRFTLFVATIQILERIKQYCRAVGKISIFCLSIESDCNWLRILEINQSMTYLLKMMQCILSKETVATYMKLIFK
jgi:hypothetical protein